MPRIELVENYPLQILSYQDLEKISAYARRDLERRMPLKRLLFAVEPDCADELDRKKVSKKLREQFQAQGSVLTPPIEVQAPRSGSHWTISDATTVYLLWRENQKLAVYTEELREPWDSLTSDVCRALQDARLYGYEAATEWEDKILKELHDLTARLEEEKGRQLQALYLDYLDTLYGAILRHILQHLPTDLVAPPGHLSIFRVGLWRYATVRNTKDKSALRQVLEMMYHGGAHFDLEYDWKVQAVQ